jgi:hypothetical protein
MGGILSGCTAQSAEDGVESTLLDGVAAGTSIQGEYYTLNCGSSLPGFPAPPCVPELRFTSLMTQVEQGPVLAPGNYVHFAFMNDSKKAAGPFSVQVKDGAGQVLKTQAFPGLAAGASSEVIAFAPLACGWTRTVVLDPANQVTEDAEWNNTRTTSQLCTR